MCNKLQGKERKKKEENHSGQRGVVARSSSASLTFMTDLRIVAGSPVQAEIHILSGGVREAHRLRIRSSPLDLVSLYTRVRV